MVKKTWPVVLLAAHLALFTGCRGSMLPPDAAPVPERTPAEAVALAERTEDPASAAELAWIEGNDRALARRRLDQGLAERPHDPGLLYRRLALRSAELDERGALDDLLALIEHAPDSVEADAALVTLSDLLSEHLAVREQIAAALERSQLLGDEAHAPLKVLAASSIASRLAALERDEAARERLVRRGGWLTRWTVIGPLGPRTQGALARATEHETAGIDPARAEPFAGVRPPVRALSAIRNSVAPASTERGGLYVMESFFEVPDAKTAVLYVQMPEAGRVAIDGARVFESALGGRRDAGWAEVELALSAGWHRISVAVLASSSSRPSFAVLGRDGRPVVGAISEVRPSAGLAATPPTITPRPRAQAKPTTAEAWVDGLRASGHAAFGSLAGAYLSSIPGREDLDRVERLLAESTARTPRSAALVAMDARLMPRRGLPRSLAEARLREALMHDPNYPSALVALARSVADDSPDVALGLLDRAQAAAPESAAPHIVRFRIHRARGWNAEAAASLEQALAKRETESLLSEGAAFWRGLSRPDEADRLEARLENLAEPSPGATRANAALRLGDTDPAIEALRAAAASSVHPVVHLARIAQLELGRGRLEAAEKAAEEALNQDPFHAGALRTLLLARLGAGDVEGARLAIQRLRTLGGADVPLEALAASIGERPPLDQSGRGTWLEQKLELDPRALVTGTRDSDLRWSRHKSVRLLERLVDDVRPDGSALSHRHTITRLLTKEATDEAGEVNLPNDALPLAVRTIKANGRIVETDRHAGKADLSFSALAPGDAVEQSWVEVEGAETAFGGYARRFFFRHSLPMLRVEYAVTVPKAARVWWRSYNGAPEPERHDDGDRVTYLFTRREVPPVDPEPNAAPWEEHLPFVVFTADLDGSTALRSNVMGLEAIDQSSWGLTRQAEALTQGRTSDEEKVHAIFRFVSDEISHGNAREPAVVLTTRRGDRTGLFLAMLRAVGLGADLVLARPGSAAQVSPEYPNPQHFGIALVRIAPSSSGRALWARMDLPSPWLGKATPDLRGGSYVLAADGAELPKPVAFSDDEIETWGLISEVDLTVDAQGTAAGTLAITLPGMYGSELRTFFRSSRTEEIARALETWVSSIIPGANLERWEAQGVETPLKPLVVKTTVQVPSFMVVDRRHLVAEQFFNTPLATRALGFPTLASYLRVPRRTTPLLLSEQQEHMTVRIALPKTSGTPVEAPRVFDIREAWGRFSQAFEWDAKARAGKLVVTQALPTRRVSLEDFPGFRDGAQAVLQASRNRLIVPLEGGEAKPTNGRAEAR